MLAELARVIGRRRATAALWGGDIVSVLLIIEDQHHFAREPIEGRHFRGLLAMRLVCDQLLYGFPALSDRA
jgi:hypothetical protein